MAGTMANPITTTCPSGLKVVVRGLQGDQINLFANKTQAEMRRIGYDLLSSVVIEVLEAGPAYPDMDITQPVDWSKVVEADRFHLYIYTRIATFGADYFFNYQCGVSSCRKRFQWGIKLDRDLRHQPLSQETIQAFVNGNRIGPVKFGSDLLVLQLVTGEIEETGVKMQGHVPEAASTIAIANRIYSLNGETSSTTKHDWVKSADMLDILDLIDTLDEHDGGIDMEIEIQCPSCRQVQKVALPLDEDFWTPDKQLRSLVRKGVVIPEGGGPIRQSLAS